MHPVSGDVVQADVCAHLDAAVQYAIDHVRAPGCGAVSVEASFCEDAFLEGIAFLAKDGFLVACITRYHMERDDERARCLQVSFACSDEALVQERLSALLAEPV